MTRRGFVLFSMLAACGRTTRERDMPGGEAQISGTPDRRKARLAARPGSHGIAAPSGFTPLGLSRGPRDGLIYVPVSYSADEPLRFALLLHGAGGAASGITRNTAEFADATGTLLLAPDSRGDTWDVLRGAYGPDVTFIDDALERVFARYAIDRSHLSVGGFSDGASYALSLGLANGDLFTHLIAFSPGFMAPPVLVGKPEIFVSHGTRDEILSIDACSRRLVPQLERSGYRVRYREFEGPHTVPPDIRREAFEWFTGRRVKAS
jgi:phospholipase/carboxylesterase